MNLQPPREDLSTLQIAPCQSQILLTIAKPKPKPAFEVECLLLLEDSSR